MSIDPTQPIPLYFQLKTLLLEEILGGRYGADSRLPTEHELCDRYRISRTPVTRALSELAEEGVILRHRRRGTFVNPHWLSRQPDQPEVRIVVPEGPWGRMIENGVPDDVQVSIVTVPRPALHQALTHAVAEGQAPDLAVLDSVWVAEFAAAGFLYALEDLDSDWLRAEHDLDFLEPLVTADRYDGQTFVVAAVADVAGL
jgi:multiple sugar transport system substrate-binding protein